jgi:uncharacterized protein YraI
MLRPRGRLASGIVIGLGLLLMAGCQLLPTATPTPVLTPLPSPFVTVTLSAKTPTPTPGVVLSYQRVGGIAGFCDSLTISSTGVVTYQAGCRGISRVQTLGPTRLAQLEQLARDIGSFRFESEDNPGRPDNLRVELSFDGSGPTASAAQQEQVSAFAQTVIAEYSVVVGTPGPTPSIVVTLGEVRNLITSDPVPNANLYAGFNTAATDAFGKFRIAAYATQTIRVTAPGYEEGQARPQADRLLTIDLVPDPQATLAIIYGYERNHEYGREYDLLHPDIQALFTHDDFIRYMEQTVNYEILETTFGNVMMLPSWVFLGRTYTDVAEVPVQMVIRQSGEQKTNLFTAHLVKADGFWRWFRGPLSAPTATPRPTVVAKPTATFQPGGYPAGTLVEVVGTAQLNLRYGPGTRYTVVTTVPLGEVLIIRGGPQFSGASLWYEVEQAATGIRGWVNANYVRPASIRPTLTPTRRPTLVPFPVGARVIVISPDDLNLRTGPGLSYPIVGKAPPGSILIIRSLPTDVDGNPWYAVEQEATGLLAWANGLYFDYAPPGGTPTPAPTHTLTPPVVTVTPMPLGIRVVVISPDDLNIHLGPGPSFPIVTTVPPGTILVLVIGPVYKDGNPWYSVARGDRLLIGWANGAYLRPAPSPTLTPSPSPTERGETATPTTMPSGYAPGAVVIVTSANDLNIRAGAGPAYPLVGTAPPGSTLTIQSGPTWVGTSPWYLVQQRTTGVVGWVNGRFVQPAPPGSDYFDLEWMPGCDPSRLEVALVLPGQDKCDPGVLTRPLSWLSNQLTSLGILAPGENLEAAQVAECATCGIIVKDAGNTPVGWIRIGGDPPGSVWRTTYTAPATQIGPRCWLRQNDQWECH